MLNLPIELAGGNAIKLTYVNTTLSTDRSPAMFRLLVVMAALSQLPGSAAEMHNISMCPLQFYGESQDTLYTNISNGVIDLCFDGSIGDKCISVVNDTTTSLTVEVNQQVANAGSAFHQAKPELVGTSSCQIVIYLVDVNGDTTMNVTLRTFGAQAVARFNTAGRILFATAHVNDKVLNDLMSSDPEVFLSLSGCTHEGTSYASNTTTCDGDTLITCSIDASLMVSYNNESCIKDAICTVTASTIIDHHGGTASVEDHCAYTLFSDTGFQVSGLFRERRRKDVMFLDGVVIHLDGPDVAIYLGQSRKVKVNGVEMNVTYNATVYGVALSKDEGGVSAYVNVTSNHTRVSFDGYTAQIYTPGALTTAGAYRVYNLDGLCTNATVPLTEKKDSSHSPVSCEMQYSEPADESINCTKVNEQCEMMRMGSFSSCHEYLDPEPYIEACNNTLCRYPNTDGLRCQFLWAYDQACSLVTHSTTEHTEGWREEAYCPHNHTFCNHTHCVHHEFCASGINGQINCFCRAKFACEYRDNQTLGGPTICEDNTATLVLPSCLLEEKGFDYRDLHLKDDTCRGHRDTHHMVAFTFNSSRNACGAVITVNDTTVLYKNAIIGENTTNIVSFFDEFHMNFSCYQNQPERQSMTFRLKDNSVMQRVVSDSWDYTLIMKAYLDADRQRLVRYNTEIQLNQTVYIELKTEGLDGGAVALVTDSCWATNGSYSDGPVRHDLITDGCPSSADDTIEVNINGVGVSNFFNFNMFRFAGDNYELSLHCDIHLCAKQSQICAPNCSGPSKRRRRRSARSKYAHRSAAIISMTWTN
nr:alpha-tectorin-like isoform X2 [Nerophis lumbriciformis]XP_061826978.1 alpha-tectorin-like isoform X2 [Nerophis lumbriciformis]